MGWARGPPALLTVQPGGQSRGPAQPQDCGRCSWSVSSVCPQVGQRTRAQQAQAPHGRQGQSPVPRVGRERVARRSWGVSNLSSGETPRKQGASKVWWLGGEEAGIGVWAQVTHPFWVTSYEGDDSKVASETPPSSALRCEGNSPC